MSKAPVDVLGADAGDVPGAFPAAPGEGGTREDEQPTASGSGTGVQAAVDAELEVPTAPPRGAPEVAEGVAETPPSLPQLGAAPAATEAGGKEGEAGETVVPLPSQQDLVAPTEEAARESPPQEPSVEEVAPPIPAVADSEVKERTPVGSEPLGAPPDAAIGQEAVALDGGHGEEGLPTCSDAVEFERFRPTRLPIDSSGCLRWEVSLRKARPKDMFGFAHAVDMAEFERLRPGMFNGDGPGGLMVRRVLDVGALNAWNLAHPDAAVLPTDRIRRVNKTAVAEAMQRELRKPAVRLQVVRYPDRFLVRIPPTEASQGDSLGHGQAASSMPVLGLAVARINRKHAQITKVDPGGLVEAWNQQKIAQGLYHFVVTEGMRIEAMNEFEATNNFDALVEELASPFKRAATIRIRRCEMARLAFAKCMRRLEIVMKFKRSVALSSRPLVHAALQEIAQPTGSMGSGATGTCSSGQALPTLAAQVGTGAAGEGTGDLAIAPAAEASRPGVEAASEAEAPAPLATTPAEVEILAPEVVSAPCADGEATASPAPLARDVVPPGPEVCRAPEAVLAADGASPGLEEQKTLLPGQIESGEESDARGLEAPAGVAKPQRPMKKQNVRELRRMAEQQAMAEHESWLAAMTTLRPQNRSRSESRSREEIQNGVPGVRLIEECEVWEIILKKEDKGQRFGFKFTNGRDEYLNERGNLARKREGPEMLLVKGVADDMLASAWNREKPSLELLPCDRIASVNGLRRTTDMQQALRTQMAVTLQVVRYPQYFLADLHRGFGGSQVSSKIGITYRRCPAAAESEAPEELEITGVAPDGLLERWNQLHIARSLYQFVVMPRMRIQAVDDIEDDLDRMQEQLESGTAGRIRIRRADVVGMVRSKLSQRFKLLKSFGVLRAGSSSGQLSAASANAVAAELTPAAE